MPLSEAEVAAALPSDGFLLAYCAWAKPQTDAPLAYHLGEGLALLAATAPINLSIWHAGQPLYGNVFILLAGRSGEDRKTTAANIGKRLLTRAAPNIVVGEPGSDEGLIDSLEVQPVQLITYSEFGGFLKRAEEGYYEKLKTRLNSLFDCQEGTRLLAGGKHRGSANPRVSIVGPCATPLLARHTDPTDWTGGFMGRWLVFYAHRSRLYVQGQAPNPQLDEWLVKDLYERSIIPVAGECKGLTPEAAQMFDTWFHDVNERALPEFIVGARARVPTFAMKSALLLGWDSNCGRDGEPWLVPEGAMRSAIAISELHLRSVTEIADVLCESKDMRDRKTILDVLTCAKEPLSFGSIIERAHLLKRRTHEILDTLLEEGNVVAVTLNSKALFMAVNRAVDTAQPEGPEDSPGFLE